MVYSMSRGDESQSTQLLEFLTVTTLPTRAANDEESRKIVRSHAIRDANRRKRQLPGTEAKKIPQKSLPKARPPPQSNFTAKFRLDGKTKKGKINLPALTTKGEGDVDKRLTALSSEIRALGIRSPILAVPGAARFDPFDTLPVKIGPRQQALIEYQNMALKQNAFAFYSKEKLFKYAAADSAWLHATLALIALHYDLRLGNGVSRECMFHRGEALRIVTERLQESPRDVSDHTIGAIASLANFDTTNGLLPGATMHLNGLIQIISHRGGQHIGLHALNGNDILQKIVAWSDLSYSTAWDLSPQFPILRSHTCSASLRELISWFCDAIVPGVNISSPHDLFGEMAEIFQALRLLSALMSKEKASAEDQRIFARGLYIVEYKLLIVLDQTDPRDDDIVLDRNSHIYGSCRLAAYLYIYMILRELPRVAEINYTLARRLRAVMERNKADLLVVWQDDLHMLLWISVMGALETFGSKDGSYFVDILKRSKLLLGLESFVSFRDALKQVLWTDDLCWHKGCIGLWTEIHGSQI